MDRNRFNNGRQVAESSKAIEVPSATNDDVIYEIIKRIIVLNSNINSISTNFSSNFKDLRSIMENNLAMTYSKFATLESKIEQ